MGQRQSAAAHGSKESLVLEIRPRCSEKFLREYRPFNVGDWRLPSALIVPKPLLHRILQYALISASQGPCISCSVLQCRRLFATLRTVCRSFVAILMDASFWATVLEATVGQPTSKVWRMIINDLDETSFRFSCPIEGFWRPHPNPLRYEAILKWVLSKSLDERTYLYLFLRPQVQVTLHCEKEESGDGLIFSTRFFPTTYVRAVVHLLCGCVGKGNGLDEHAILEGRNMNALPVESGTPCQRSREYTPTCASSYEDFYETLPASCDGGATHTPAKEFKMTAARFEGSLLTWKSWNGRRVNQIELHGEQHIFWSEHSKIGLEELRLGPADNVAISRPLLHHGGLAVWKAREQDTKNGLAHLVVKAWTSRALVIHLEMNNK